MPPASRAATPTRRPAAAPRPKGDTDAAAKNQALVEDIRLLGRILGEVIREQEGKDAFELIERVRKLSVAYRLKQDASADRATFSATGSTVCRRCTSPTSART